MSELYSVLYAGHRSLRETINNIEMYSFPMYERKYILSKISSGMLA